MRFREIFTNLFTKKKVTLQDQVKKTIRRMGYKYGGDDTFVKKSYNGRTIISLMDTGIKIKVYAHGYAESDFLPNPIIDQKQLKKFIRENEL